MSDYAIRAEGLGKRYRIGRRESYRTLRDTVADAVSAPFRRFRSTPNPAAGPAGENHSIWALKDVSFDVRPGEVLGIIGRNGVGKTTLLKILSRITEPTEGHARIRGRVSSLLEVGTGFHPELTGRENVYLNGAVLGMRKAEIDRRFDEIVAFAEVERFIDTPVKHYSSGMAVRLAFAVAAHLEPENLLVDEVLAVGDVAFQRKCLGKMGDVTRQGRTVLFVSHNMQAVSTLCHSTLLLSGGRVAAHGPTAEVVDRYLAAAAGTSSAEAAWTPDDAPGTGIVRLRSVQALDESGQVSFDMWMNRPITLRVEFSLLRMSRIEVSLHLYNRQGLLLFATGNFNDPAWRDVEHEPGTYECSWTIPKHLLNEGQHFVKIYLGRDIEIADVISFDVRDPGDTRGGWTDNWLGAVRPILPWTGRRIGDLP